MADKKPSREEGPRRATPAREGNPSKRQRQFNAERGAVLRVPDAEAQGDEPEPDKARVEEHRRRERNAPRTPPPADADDEARRP